VADSNEKEEVSEEIQGYLKEICDHFELEDRSVRERQIRNWRKLKLHWEGYSRLYYDSVAHDWRIWDQQQQGGQDNYQNYYDKPINIFRALLESIIAALSVTVPPIKCYPDDADNDLDITTAKGGDKIAALIFRHNDAPLLWVHALFTMVTEGMVACYSYPKSDPAYGTYEVKEEQEYEEMHQIGICPNCGTEVSDDIVDESTNQVKDQFGPDDNDAPLQNLVINDNAQVCPNCMQMIDPNLENRPLIATRIVGVTQEPKTRVCLEVYGGLYVKVPVYARNQSDVHILEYLYETNIVNVLERYPHLYDKFDNNPDKFKAAAGAYNTFEQWARLSPQYQNEIPRDTITVRNFWLRPCAYNQLSKDKSDKLKKEFPNGCKVVFVNDCFADGEDEALDDCWTLTSNPLSDYIHFEPDGQLAVSTQEITNDIISFTIQTIEQGIGQTFADQSVLNFDQYAQREALPGAINPVKVPSGRSINDFFHEMKTAALSGEVLPFTERVNQLGQLSTGALPSLFGGQMTESKTASEYSMSRNQASQRLQIKWKMITFWWKNIFGKVIPIYIKEVQADERDVERDESGNFVNVFVRKAELSGKIGRIELEANENIPLTWNQRKDVVMELLKLGNEDILAQLGHPDNLPILREAIGLENFFVPGEDEREAELEEIKLLVNAEPIVVPPMIDPMMAQQMMASGQPIPPEMQQAMQPQEMPSIEINADIDNNALRFEVDRKWLVSEAGRQAKTEKPEGYKNVLLHALQHKQADMMMQMQAAMAQGAAPSEKPGENTETPITQESDVNAAN